MQIIDQIKSKINAYSINAFKRFFFFGLYQISVII